MIDPQTFNSIQHEREGKTLVFTNGVFDILHAGHVTYLAAAKALGDILVVGVNTDESVHTLNKAPNRPINPLHDRITVLQALRSVDIVIPFSEQTPENLIQLLKPDIHVKGGDYKEDDLPEAKIVKSYGGKVAIIPLLPGRSSTNILNKLGS